LKEKVYEIKTSRLTVKINNRLLFNIFTGILNKNNSEIKQ